MRSLAIGTVVASALTTVVALLLIAGTRVDVVPVGYRLPEMLPFVAVQLAFTAVGAVLVLRRPDLLGVVHGTIRPAYASVWLRDPTK